MTKHQEQSDGRKAEITTRRWRVCVIIIGLPPRICLQTVQLSWEFDEGSMNRKKKGDNAYDETKINVFTLPCIF